MHRIVDLCGERIDDSHAINDFARVQIFAVKRVAAGDARRVDDQRVVKREASRLVLLGLVIIIVGIALITCLQQKTARTSRLQWLPPNPASLA